MTTRDEREGPGAGGSDVFLQHLTQGGDLLAAGHTEEALGYLESALSMNPGDEKAQNLLGLCCFKLGHLDRAAEIYEHLVRENPVDPTLRVNLGLVYLKANAVQRAVREFETAAEIAPEHRKAHNYLGLALAQAAEYGRAREHFLLAGSEHMAEKMARALDGAGFEPVTTPAGGVAALDVPTFPGPDEIDAPLGAASAEGMAGEVVSGEAAQWDASGASPQMAGGWSAEAGWEPNAGPEDAWGDPAAWGEVAAGHQGWAHPDDAPDWAHPERSPDAMRVNDAQVLGGAPWSQDGGEQAAAPAFPDAWPQDAGADLPPYDQPQGDEAWSQDDTAQVTYGEPPEGGAWPEDGGAEQLPSEQFQGDEAWSQDDAAQVTYGEPPEGGAWPEDGGAELLPSEQLPGDEAWPQDGAEQGPYGEPLDGGAWPPDTGPELQPPPSHRPGAAEGLIARQSPPLDQPVETDGAATRPEGGTGPEDGAVAEHSAGGSGGGLLQAGKLPVATSALDDDLETEPSRAPLGGEDLQVGAWGGEKVASLRPARLEDSWGAQFGLEGEGAEASEPAEELVVELNAAEVAEPEAEHFAPGSPVPETAPAEVPDRNVAPSATADADRGPTAVPQEPDATGGPDAPGLPMWEQRPGARATSGWLVELSRQLELRPGPSTEAFTELGDGVLDLQLREGLRTRPHGYFALEGKVRLTPENRRIRGRASAQLFGPAGRELMRVQGSGHLLVRVPGRQLLPLELGEEGLFLREASVYAFEENVMFENGSLSDPEGNEALKLVHLRGTGRLLVELEGALRTVQIREGAPARIELSRIVGWFGELVPQAVAAVTGLSAHLELSGQGFALIDAAHRETSA